jgi:subtilisin family serine protease
MSLGGKRTPSEDPRACPDDEQRAIYHALRKGALVIAAVGNTGPTPNTVEDPGVCLGVLSVGAVDRNGQVATFSGRVPYLSLSAPGVNVPSLGRIAGQAFAGDGSSQATALTSAVAALVWSAHRDLDARAVATRLLATLDDARRAPSPDYGYGLLNAYRAVTADVPAGAANPVYDRVEPFLRRADVLRRPLPPPPPAAGTDSVSLGSYAVGSRPWLTWQAKLGIALGALGLLVAAGSGWGLRRRAPTRRPHPGPVRRRPRPYARPSPGAPRRRPAPTARVRPSPGPPAAIRGRPGSPH